MKKTIFILLSIISVSLVFMTSANSEENVLNLIVGVQGQFTQADSDLVQQKINDLNTNLNLSDDQKQQTQEIAVDSAKKMNVYQVNFIQAKNQLISLQKSGAPIQSIQNQLKLMQTYGARMNITRQTNMQNFEAILNTEQKAYFDQFKNDLKQIKQSERQFSREITTPQNRNDALNQLQTPNN